MNINKIIVATDFSAVSDTAIEHALKLASFTKGEVFVLHVIIENVGAEAAKRKIAKQLESQNVGSVQVSSMVRIGNFINEIGYAASEIDAQLIIMGTHGPRGLIQTIRGSDAMKVITHSEKPFIVVQEKGIKETGYDNIVVPMDMTEDSKQKLDEVADIAKYFNSKIHIIAKFVMICSSLLLANKLPKILAFNELIIAIKSASFSVAYLIISFSKSDFGSVTIIAMSIPFDR